MAVIDWAIPKEEHAIILKALQTQALQQLHVNHIAIEKKKLLVNESIYWTGMNFGIENHIQTALHFLTFSKHNQNKTHHEIPGKPWEVIEADMFTLYNRNYLCIVDYPSKFPVIKKEKIYQQTA